MNRGELQGFYKELYFHEIEMRKDFNGRLQLPVAILVTLFGYWGYMLKGLSGPSSTFLFALFLLMYIIVISLTIIATAYFVRSWHGHEYVYLPSALDIDDYRIRLHETYNERNDCDLLVAKYMDEFIGSSLIECSSINSNTNDRRASFLHRTNFCIILSGGLAFLAFIPFYLRNN